MISLGSFSEPYFLMDFYKPTCLLFCSITGKYNSAWLEFFHIFSIQMKCAWNIVFTGKGQNVKNHFVKSQKKNIESPQMSKKNIKNQNIESLH